MFWARSPEPESTTRVMIRFGVSFGTTRTIRPCWLRSPPLPTMRSTIRFVSVPAVRMRR